MAQQKQGPARDSGFPATIRTNSEQRSIGLVALWRDKTRWQRLMRNGMKEDFSWAASARRYVRVFETAIASTGVSGV